MNNNTSDEEKKLFEKNNKEKDKKTAKSNYAFKQQLLTAWKPKPTLLCAIICYIVIGIIFIIFGAVLVSYSNEVNDFYIRYDNLSICEIGKKCKMAIEITKKFNKPIFVYYEISDFYQNNRIYAKSIVSKQLRGNKISSSEADSCATAKYNKDFGDMAKKSINNDDLDPDEIAYPCGLAARAFFNDTFVLEKITADALVNEEIPISDKGIAWKDDIKHKFKNYDLSKQWLNVENERFINWMKVAPFSKFRKTWGKIDQDLETGSYILEIDNKWDSKIFGGKKKFGLIEANEFGSQNYFLGYSYIFIGCLSFVFAIGFSIRKIQRPKGVLEKRLKEAEKIN